ncbi:hypothetical protein BKA66DRAFT_473740 [Pyrenochaeta sp. MPI-SDFR-AT-0127]|nr:hypothetical protein BKA66DRAFT_473740 [Pyrenochaeta sp. MPI-SDFR-AT-0127]
MKQKRGSIGLAANEFRSVDEEILKRKNVRGSRVSVFRKQDWQDLKYRRNYWMCNSTSTIIAII